MSDRLALVAALMAGCLAACAPEAKLPSGAAPAHGDIVLNGHTLRLHFANRHSDDSRPLLVYATGDGGWHRKDLEAWHQLASWGYPAVGFDARDYVTHLGAAGGTTTPQRLAEDYSRIVDAARRALGLPASRLLVLVGMSRGADLAVVAAGAAPLHGQVGGVLAVALTREEEYADTPRLYEYLAERVADLPVAVVQSTRDNYVPAAEARALIGPDTARRRLQAIDARNHSFAGARPELYRAMSDALDWIGAMLPDR